MTQSISRVIPSHPEEKSWSADDRQFIAFNVESDMPVAESQPQSGMRTKQNENSRPLESGIPVFENQFHPQYAERMKSHAEAMQYAERMKSHADAARTEHNEIEFSVVLLGLTLLGLFWYVAAISRKARVARTQKVKNIATNTTVPENKGRYSNGAWAMPDLSGRPIREIKIVGKTFSDEATAHDIEVEFKNVFFNRTDNDRERIVAHLMNRKRCGRFEAMRWAIDDWRNDRRSWR